MFEKLKDKLHLNKNNEQKNDETTATEDIVRTPSLDLDEFSNDEKTEEKYLSFEEFVPEPDYGLTLEQVEKRKAQNLVNVIKNKNSKSYLSIICNNLFTFFNLLCITCVIALLIVNAKLSDMVFAVIFVLNMVIGIIQEIRSKRAVEKLMLVKAPTVQVVRGGKECELPASEIVLGDIIKISMGNQIPTDSVLVKGNVDINESLLTGESNNIKKNVGDKLYAGSFVSSGNAYIRAIRIGEDSYIQKLSARAKKFKKAPSKLTAAMNAMIKAICAFIIPISILMAINNYKSIKLGANFSTHAELIQETVLKTSTVVIGLIPSGMFLLTSIALAVGVLRLTKKKTLVQDMYSLEMLARVDVLCLDKTGTITDGRMKVCGQENINKDETNYLIEDVISSMLGALSDNNQTAIALNDRYGVSAKYIPKATIPFSSERKYSAVSFVDNGTFVMGAPDFVLKKIPKNIEVKIKAQTTKGRRVILIAHSGGYIENEKLPSELLPYALIYFEDNIREDAISTIKWFKDNDVQIKIISGDDPVTVSEIARRAGVNNADKYINLDGLNEKEVFNVASEYTVFGRVSPEQKAILIKSLKAHGHTVAMTGDGVNDILAMKESDCSVTVASGSEATRHIAHLVLMNNDFSSLPSVVNEGRRVVNNIQSSSSLYLMKTLFTAIFAIITILRKSTYPFNPSMMLMLESCVIGLPSIILSIQPNAKRISGNFTATVLTNALPGAVILVLNVYLMQIITKYLHMQISPEFAQTLSVLVLTFGGVVFLFRMCEPFNTYRGIMMAFIFTITIVWALFFLDSAFFRLESILPIKDNWQYILIIICIIQFDFPFEKFFLYLMKKLRHETTTPTVR